MIEDEMVVWHHRLNEHGLVVDGQLLFGSC